MCNYRILIIEDDKDNWADYMEEALSELLPNSIIDLAQNASDAKEKMRKYYYHFISYDQNLPDQEKGLINADVGLALLKESSKHYLCSKHISYTAYSTTNTKTLDNQTKIEIWEKARFNNTLTGLSTDEWAEKVAQWLQSEYKSFYFSQASAYLPPCLAKQAAEIAKVLIKLKNKPVNNNLKIKYLFDSVQFCNLTLRLATTQAMIIAKKGKHSFYLPNDDSLQTITGKLIELLAIEDLWSAYLPFKQATDGIEKIAAKISDYQENFYKQSPANWLELEKDINDCLHTCMTIATFWAEFPFLTQIKNNVNRLEGRLIRGIKRPWETVFLINNTENFNKEHIYLTGYDNKFTPIDSTPFINLEYNEVLKCDQIWVLCSQQNGKWIYWSLLDGKIQAKQPSSEEAMIFAGS